MSVPVPRSYQSNAIANARESVKAGRRRVLLVSPTGSGKSTIGALIARGALAKGQRVAWFAHRSELRDQARETMERCEIDAGYSGQGASKPCQIVSLQGALRKGEVPEADVVILDEAHHMGADDWGRLPGAYPNAVIVGLSATPERGDGRGLGHIFNDLHVVAQPRELVDLWKTDHSQGLTPCEVVCPGRVQSAGYLSQSPVDAYVQLARGTRNVVFAPDVKSACDFAAQFKAAGISAHIVHGALSAEVRRKNLEDFAAGRVLVLVNVFVLTEGWDCPSVSTVTIARKMGSTSMYLQGTGRGLRPSPGKQSCLVIDLAGISHLHGHPLEDRKYLLTGIGIRLVAENGRPKFCRACGSVLEEAGPCPNCLKPVAPGTPMRFSGDPLAKFAAYRIDTEAERAERLAKWITQARAKGHDWKTSLYRYKGTYQMPPPKKIVKLALELARSNRQ